VNTIAMWMAISHLDGHLVADRAAGLDDGRHAGPGAPSGCRPGTGSRRRRHHRGLGPVAGRAQRDLDRDLAARLAGPIPTVAPFRARTIAFERTWRTARQANSRSFSSSSVGRRVVTTWSGRGRGRARRGSRRAGRRRRA
jgi:hypothetical protein